MPQKAPSTTTSSKSATSNDPALVPVQYVKGVGPRLAAVLARRDIKTVMDLLYFFPRAYEDRTTAKTLAQAVEGEKATFALTSLGGRKIVFRGGKSVLEVRAQDETGTISLKWFHGHASLIDRYHAGVDMMVTGVPKKYMGRLEIIHPEITSGEVSLESATRDFGRIIPVYVEIEGIPTRTLRKILWEAISKYGASAKDDLPPYLREARKLPALYESLTQIHFPDESTQVSSDLHVDFKSPWHQRLIYEEFFKFEYLVLKERGHAQKDKAPLITKERGAETLAGILPKLPFELTGDQKKVLDQMLDEISAGIPINRLIQGDVGSGKTIVALLICAVIMKSGGQCALMAPTEILAEQHLKSALKFFGFLLGPNFRIELLTGRAKNQDRERIAAVLASGTPTLMIGTHALIEDWVKFKQLDLLIVDEQHRFGVDQRRKLKDKGVRDNGKLVPHRVVLSATPIPRTLALTLYGELSVSTIKEKPPGRKPIKTHIVLDAKRGHAFSKIRDEIAKGRQAYFISPLIEQSEAEGFDHLRSATETAQKLSTEVFPNLRIGLLHGQMTSDQKEEIMGRFKNGLIDVLVSTTVVEVGVDVPNATVMAIDHAERFGLSQLHQLRGRVGRGEHASFCFLFTHPRVGEETLTRLKIMERTEDGFEVAEADLKARGPGEFLGTRQSGDLPFKVADLVRDQDILFAAREDAAKILEQDPDLQDSKHLALRNFLDREGKTQGALFRTS